MTEGGEETRTVWLGYVSYEELLKVYNPESGWLMNCSDHPQYVTINSGITSDPPSRMNDTGFGKRGKMLTALLSGKSFIKPISKMSLLLKTLPENLYIAA